MAPSAMPKMEIWTKATGPVMASYARPMMDRPQIVKKPTSGMLTPATVSERRLFRAEAPLPTLRASRAPLLKLVGEEARDGPPRRISELEA
jgi:hypothetical protein